MAVYTSFEKFVHDMVDIQNASPFKFPFTGDQMCKIHAARAKLNDSCCPDEKLSMEED